MSGGREEGREGTGSGVLIITTIVSDAGQRNSDVR